MRKFTFILSVAAICLLSACSETKQEKKSFDCEGLFNHTVGNTEIVVLPADLSEIPLQVLRGYTAEMFSETLADSALSFPVANAFLLRTAENKLVLLDAGNGMQIFKSLEKLKIAASEIDVIFLSHLHFDHTGGLLLNDTVAFQNAQVYVSLPEYTYWKQQDSTTCIGVEAYGDRFHTFDGTESKVNGIKTILAPGHTPGHLMFVIGDETEQMVIWSDLAHALAIQMPYPEVSLVFDADSAMGVSTRMQNLPELTKENTLVAGMHIAYPSMGRLKENGKGGYIFLPLEKKK